MSQQNKNRTTNFKKDSRDSKSRNKRGRNNNNSASVRDERSANSIHVSQPNDVSWYTRFPQFAKDAATLPFSQPLGAPLEIIPSHNYYVPGVMRLGFYPTIGVSKTATSPINRASVRFFTWLRAVQKASAKYDHQDATIMMVAMDSCYMFHSLMRRAYGIANLYSPVNRYYPKALLNAMGFDISIVNDLARFRAYINRFAISLGQYTIPDSLDLFNRHKWMCEGVYADSQSAKAQSYIFCPEGFWKYSNTGSVGSELHWDAWNEPGAATITTHTLDEVIAFGDELIGAFSGDEDFAYISGDIYALYGNANTVHLEETPENYQVLPVFNEVVLTQIENASFTGKWASDYDPVITQNPSVNDGRILFDPYLFIPAINNADKLQKFLSMRNTLNMHVDSPSPDLVMEATRLQPVWDERDKTATNSFSLRACGTEILTFGHVYTFSTTDGTMKINVIASPTFNVEAGSTAEELKPRMQMMSMLATFDWAPRFWVTDFSKSEVLGATTDFDNFAYILKEQLEMLHEASLLSEFDIPQMG